MLWDQGLNPHSVLVTIGLALFIITRPGLSSQRYVAPPVDAKGQEIRYTRITPGNTAGCSAYVWRGKYRWVCDDNADGDDRNEAILPDSDGIARFSVYYRFQGPDQGAMAPEYSTPMYYQEYQVFPSIYPLLYTTYDGCLATPPGAQILLWNMGSIKIEPSSPKEYAGEKMPNPWWKSRIDREKRGVTSQVPSQEDKTALAPSPISPEFQLSSLSPDAGPLETKDTETPSQSFLDNNTPNTNPEAEISYPKAANIPGSSHTAIENFPASTDFTDLGLWQKQKRASRAVNQRRRRVVPGDETA